MDSQKEEMAITTSTTQGEKTGMLLTGLVKERGETLQLSSIRKPEML